jgi:HD-like signal output (HDOD) protein
MVETVSDPQQEATAAVERARHLGIVPETASRIVRMTDDPECSIQEIAQVFTADPVLGAQLLKVANSAFYGLRAQVTNITHAASVLGGAALRSVALASGVGPLIRRATDTEGFSMRSLLEHSLGVAAGARTVAATIGGGDPEDAFAAGLFHDLGIVVAVHDRPEAFAELTKSLTEQPVATATEFLERERALLGTDHRLLGHALGTAWGFPAKLTTAVLYHHDPDAAPEDDRVLPAIVGIADTILDEFGDHGREDCLDSSESAAVAGLYALLSRDELEKLEDKVREAAAETRGAFA